MELSRRRSIKLKAQVDKLQESRDGPGWSQHREEVKFTHRKNTHGHQNTLFQRVLLPILSKMSNSKFLKYGENKEIIVFTIDNQ